MSTEETGAAADLELPLIYRIILRFPMLSFDGLSGNSRGLVWVVFLPVMMACNFFVILALFACIAFPYNYVAVLAWISAISMFIFRILLQRAINTRRAMVRQSSFRWSVEKTFDEYSRLLSEKKKARNGSKE